MAAIACAIITAAAILARPDSPQDRDANTIIMLLFGASTIVCIWFGR